MNNYKTQTTSDIERAALQKEINRLEERNKQLWDQIVIDTEDTVVARFDVLSRYEKIPSDKINDPNINRRVMGLRGYGNYRELNEDEKEYWGK